MTRALAIAMIVVAVGGGFVGCVFDEESPLMEEEREDLALEEEEAAWPADAVEVPEELSFERLSKEGEVGALACRVRLQYCRDPRHNRRPTYCASGCHWWEQAVKAVTLCHDTCDNCDRLKEVNDC